MEFEDIISKGIKYIERVREETSKYKVNNPGFVSLLACLHFADENNIDFNSLVNAVYAKAKFRTVDKFRNDFNVYENFCDRSDLSFAQDVFDTNIN